MILLERANRILGETISARLFQEIPEPSDDKEEGKDKKSNFDALDAKLCDFDDTIYKVTVEEKTPTVMNVSMSLPCYKSIEKYGAKEALDRVYGSMVAASAVDGFDLTLAIKMDELKDQKAKEAVVANVSMLKHNVLGGVFDFFFNALLKGTVPEPFKFDLRNDTTVFFVPKADRVTVVFTVDFREKVDRAIAKVFMQEFMEARKQVQAAPPVTFGVNPPLELAPWKIPAPQPGQPPQNLGYISFSVQKSNLDGTKKDKVVAVLQGFRNYIQYHIKCSKAHFHARMRARVVSLLGVLNRAKAEVDPKTVQARTISGKTFTRK
jgi:actin related protein 2/3 complex, subunit 2